MKNIVVIGMKNCGKSTFSRLLAQHYDMSLVEEDKEIEDAHFARSAERLTFREIFKKHGEEYFRSLETETLKQMLKDHPENTVIDMGGGAPLREENREIIRQMGAVVFLGLDKEVNYSRIMQNGVPAFFKDPNDPKGSFELLWETRMPIYHGIAQVTIPVVAETPEQILEKYLKMEIK